jgi:DNA-binding NtrC family response regulator
VERAIEVGNLRRENRSLRQQLNVASTAAGFVAESEQSKQLVALIRRVAPARSTALIEGESGTGKELVARMLHYWSKRSEGPFIAINCKAIATGVMESELFGHEKGSFTGAIAGRAGCFERASGGTLFLDELAEADADFQGKLLRVLEDGEVMRVGASKPRKIDVRVVAATNRILREEVAAGRFRSDLYYRLNVIPLRLVPLRERHDDILPLARHFLAYHAAEVERSLRLAAEAEQALLAYSWPGNVRELQNVIERAVVISGAEVLTVDALALEAPLIEPRSGAAEVRHPERDRRTLQECLDEAARGRIRDALNRAGGNRVEAATLLGVDRTTLYRLMKRLGLG